MKSRLILASIIIGIIIIGNLNSVFAPGANISVSAGSVEKQSLYLEEGDTINFEVVVNGGKNNDILFSIDSTYVQSSSTTVYSYLKDDYVAPISAYYDFIFDNKMSVISTKNIQFDWQITKPVMGVTHSNTSGYVVNSAGWFYILVFAGIIGTIIAAVAAHKRKKRKGSDYSNVLDEDNDDSPPTVMPSKKPFGKKCDHLDTWVREDDVEICSICGKELGKIKSESKPVESQQNLDSYVTQAKLAEESEKKETINDIESNEEALGILKERLAKGEITVQEFQEIKKELS